MCTNGLQDYGTIVEKNIKLNHTEFIDMTSVVV